MVALATIRPWSSTTISSASAIVERRWAITNVVRPAIASASASLMLCSVEASTEEVASSRISTRGFATQRARDRQALALAAGERQAALADLRVIALRQARDELVRLRAARRLLRSPRGGAVRARVGDVLGDARGEQERVVADDRDGAAHASARSPRARRRRRAAPRRRRGHTAARSARRGSSCPSRWRPTSATVRPAGTSRSMSRSTARPLCGGACTASTSALAPSSSRGSS